MTTLYLRASATRVGGAAALPGSGDLPDATICMDVYNGQVTQGNYPQSWSCNTCWNQKWLLAGGVEHTAEYLRRPRFGNSTAGTRRSAQQSSSSSSSDGSTAVVARRSNSSMARGGTGRVALPLTCPPIPTPKPAHHGECEAGWPVFQTAADLEASTWGAYIKEVYGSVPVGATYPWCMGDLWALYADRITALKVTPVPASAGQCPTNGGKTVGQLYTHNNLFQPSNMVWIWHGDSNGRTPLAASSWVEVIHMRFTGDEHVGAWFFYAKGSGIWFNVSSHPPAACPRPPRPLALARRALLHAWLTRAHACVCAAWQHHPLHRPRRRLRILPRQQQ